MSSEVEICNRALQKLGAARITSLTDGSKNARACLTAYASLRDAELMAHPWNFSVQRFQLAANPVAPLFGRTTAFPLPTGWLQLLPPDPEWNYNDRDWVVEGNEIMTNESSSPLNARLVMQVVNPDLMTPLFREALASRIAYELCEEITQSNEKKKDAAEDYKAQIYKAKKANAFAKVPMQPVLDTWISQRL